VTTHSGTLTPPTWRELPDPRGWFEGSPKSCTVRFTVEALGHIIERHMTDGREPWDQWLPPEHVAHLVQVWRDGFPTGLDPEVFESVADSFGQAVRASLERPLALLAVSLRPQSPPGARGRATWNLVTPHGAIFVIRPRRGLLVTGYFHRAACGERRPNRRWRAVVRSLVRRYANWTDQGIRPPHEADLVEVRTPAGALQELRTQIQFVTPNTWGFCPELDGSPWRGRLGEWPLAPASTPKTKRFHLKPRRPRQDEDSHG